MYAFQRTNVRTQTAAMDDDGGVMCATPGGEAHGPWAITIQGAKCGGCVAGSGRCGELWRTARTAGSGDGSRSCADTQLPFHHLFAQLYTRPRSRSPTSFFAPRSLSFFSFTRIALNSADGQWRIAVNSNWPLSVNLRRRPLITTPPQEPEPCFLLPAPHSYQDELDLSRPSERVLLLSLDHDPPVATLQ